jgi:hypothetical protein
LQQHITEQYAIAANAAGEAERFGFGMGRGHKTHADRANYR